MPLEPTSHTFIHLDAFFGFRHEFVFDPSETIPRSPQRSARLPPNPNVTFGEFSTQPEPDAIMLNDTHNVDETQYDIFKEIQFDVNEWCRSFGGITNWPSELEQSYQVAIASSRLEEWVTNVWSHAEEGRAILRRLKEMEGRLPWEMWKIRELWRVQCELVERLARGISYLELRSSLLDLGPLNLVLGSRD